MNNFHCLVLCLQIVMSLTAPLELQKLMEGETLKNLPTLPTAEIEVKVRHMQEQKSTLKSEKTSLQKERAMSLVTTLQNKTPDKSLKPMEKEIPGETEFLITDKKSRQMPFSMLQMPMPVYPQMQYPMSLPRPMVERNPPEILPMLPPMAEGNSLQQQMLALQQIQAMQNMGTIHAPSSLYIPQAQQMLLLLPSSVEDMNTQDEESKHGDESSDVTSTKLKGNINNGYLDEELDSVILEAESETKNKRTGINKGFRKAVLLIPGQRFSIGGIISSIPWLPIEVNVPDTIAWAYNGIADGIGTIISIIGQRWPFKRPVVAPTIVPVVPEDNSQVNVKMFLKQLQKQNEEVIPSPVIVIPVNEILPMRKTSLPMSPIMVMPAFGNMQHMPMYPQMIPGQM